MPMIANPGGALGYGFQGGIATQYGASAIASAAYGGANYAVGEATGFNPLAGVTPTPWMGAVYGAAAGMPWPWEAAGALKEGLFGPSVRGYKQSYSSPSGWRHQNYGRHGLFWRKSGGAFGKAGSFASREAAEAGITKRQFAGVIGWKTMLLGVQPSGGVWAKMSIGNVGLSVTEMIGKSMAAIDPTWNSPTVQKMANARRLGLAGMFNVVDEAADIGDLKHGWLYKLAGVDPENAKFGSLNKGGVRGKSIKISTDLVKKGLHLKAIGTAGRVFNVAGGAFSLWSWMSIIKDTTQIVSNVAAQGFGEAAKRLYSFMGEVNQPDFGRGYIPEALDTRGAATERQRALRAAYSAKINPQNRMYGNEAMYHHSR